MPIPTAPAELSYTDGDSKETVFSLISIGSDSAMYRATKIQDQTGFPVYAAPTLLITRRPPSNNQTQRKYTIKSVFPVYDSLTNVKIAEWIYVTESSRPSLWGGGFAGGLPSTVNGGAYIEAINAFLSTDEFVESITDETFLR